MGNDISEYVRKFYDLQAEATKEIMRMSFFLNSGGIAATLSAFGSSDFHSLKGPIILCLLVFILGLVLAVVMALEVRAYAYYAFSRTLNPSTTESTLRDEVQNHRGKHTVYILCISSLAFFGMGTIIGLIILCNLF